MPKPSRRASGARQFLCIDAREGLRFLHVRAVSTSQDLETILRPASPPLSGDLRRRTAQFRRCPNPVATGAWAVPSTNSKGERRDGSAAAETAVPDEGHGDLRRRRPAPFAEAPPASERDGSRLQTVSNPTMLRSSRPTKANRLRSQHPARPTHDSLLGTDAFDQLHRPDVVDNRRVSALRFGDPRALLSASL